MAMLCLHCRADSSLVAVSREGSLVVASGLLIAVASFVVVCRV